MTLKLDGWILEIIWHLFYATSSFAHYLKAMMNNTTVCDIQPVLLWSHGQMTLKVKGIICDTSSDASDHLWQIWKESIEDCRRYRADTIFKIKAKQPWKYRSRSKVITCDTPSDATDDLCQIWKECKRNCRLFFKVKAEKLEKFAKNWNFRILF